MTAPPKPLDRWLLLIPPLLAAVAGLALALSAKGLPLDDAYIFRRYAENLAQGQGFSFNPHETSFGCTSFLWPVLVSFFLRIFGIKSYLFVVQALGILAYSGAVFLAGAITRALTRERLFALAAGLLAATSPALFMNAVSGMETALFVFEIALLIWLVGRFGFRPIPLGLLSALLFLTRPEGLLPAALIPLAFLIRGTPYIIPLVSPELSMVSPKFRKLILFGICFLVPVLPYLGFVLHHTGHFLPGTYLGKIMAQDPALLQRAWPEKLLWALISLADGWNKLIAPLQLLGWIILAATLYLGLAVLWNLVKRRAEIPPGLLIILPLLFLPAAYGYSFPVSPPFGGYYHRYIAAVMLSFAIAGCAGLFRLYQWIAFRRPRGDWRRLVFPAGFAVFLLYLAAVSWPQWQEGQRVFKQEVSLNEGLRLDAALWLARHTSKDARILVGYTGLGVVGGNCGRWVYDLGALINPDIFDYYQGTKPLTEKRWQQVLRYIADRHITWYVTFHYSLAPDPARSPGFQEVARLGTPGEPNTPYEQIRIYRIFR